MRKYFYLEGTEKKGPFSREELDDKPIDRNTKFWFYGLPNWTPLDQIPELEDLAKSFPPPIKALKEEIKDKKIQVPTEKDQRKGSKKNVLPLAAFAIIVLVIIAIYLARAYNPHQRFYEEVVASSYDADEDFSIYVDKFYRDAEVFGIFPKRPSKTIIKFSRLDQLDNATHIHALSYGFDDDDLIEIYINPSTWARFNRGGKHFLMFHELSHDILNLDDLSSSPINKGKLMYPEIASYEKITMDQFIDAFHEVLEDVSSE